MDRQLPTTTNELRVTVVRTRDSAGDEELVAAAKGGDELAFEKIVKRHRQRIFALALRYARSREDAEDIVQQTFQRAFIHLRGFEGRSSFSTWLTSIGINQSLMLLRRRRVLREVPIDDPSDDEGTTPALEMADTSPDPASSYLEQEEARVLVEAIGQLRPAIRKAVELTGLRELSMVEAARQLGISVVAMKSRMFHARRKLGEALKRNMRSRRVSGDGISAVAKDARRIPQNHLDCAWN
jgi:RNA polymerase sigma-70 factor (ECF subfamily)